MHQPPYSTRFLLYSGSAAGTVASFTVPAGYVAVLRDIDLLATSAALTGAIVQAGTAYPGILWTGPTAATTSRAWRGRQVFYAGEVIRCYVFDGSWDVLASGYLLSS